MSKFYKDLGGAHYETLAKAIYREDFRRVIDPNELYLPLLALPRSIISWCVENVRPIGVNDSQKLQIPGSDAVIEVRKLAPDLYSGSITLKGRVINQFDKIPLPTVGGTLLNVLELYDDVAGRKVEETEKAEIAAKAMEPSNKDVMERLGQLIDLITAKNAVRKDETPAAAPAAPQPVVVNITMNAGDGKPSVQTERTEKSEMVAKAAPPRAIRRRKEFDLLESRDPHPDPIKRLGNALQARKDLRTSDPVDTVDSGNAMTYGGLNSPPIATVSTDGAVPRRPGAPGVSRMGGQVRSGNLTDAKAQAAVTLSRLRAQPKIAKARQDDAVAPEQRADARAQRRAQPADPLQAEMTSQDGVSERGIEARRADPRIPEGKLAHGYGRVTTPAKHHDRALKYFGQTLNRIRSQKKLPLGKTQLEKKAPRFEAPQLAAKMPAQAQIKPDMPGRPRVPTLNGPKDPVSSNKMENRAPATPKVAAAPKAPGAAKAPSAPKAPAAPKGMTPVAKITKRELNTARSDDGSKLFTKDEYDRYKFNPTGLWAVMQKDSLQLQKNEDDYHVYVNPKEWDDDNVRLLNMVFRASKRLWG